MPVSRSCGTLYSPVIPALRQEDEEYSYPPELHRDTGSPISDKREKRQGIPRRPHSPQPLADNTAQAQTLGDSNTAKSHEKQDENSFIKQMGGGGRRQHL